MTFIWPVMLVALISIPIFIGIYGQLLRRRKRILASFGDFTGIGIQQRQAGRIRHTPAVLFMLGLGLLSLAMARPQMVVNLPRVEGTVILVFDVSGSMAADDLPPNRISAAKSSAIEFVKSQPPGVRIGVVAFSESGISIQAPTDDQDAILTSIERLQPQSGTSLGYGILTAMNTIMTADFAPKGTDDSATPVPASDENFGEAIMVLISDGENTAPPDPFEAAFEAAQHGVRIYSIGIGRPEGAILHINGFTVHTQLNEEVLQQISGLTGGTYFNAASPDDLSQIYSEIAPELVVRPEQMEVTALMAGASLIFLLVGGWLTLIWFGRLP